MFVHDFLRNNILNNRGVTVRNVAPPLETIMKTEWCQKFIDLMRNRLIMGFFRYGPAINDNSTSYSRIDSIRQRLSLYESDGNAEHLVDIANICLVEFLNESHPKFHWNAQDDGIHIQNKE